MASTACVLNVLSENLKGNGEKEIRGRVTFATYDQAANPLMNISNYLKSSEVPTVVISSSASGYTFVHSGGTVAAGTVAALYVGNINASVGGLSQVANGTALGATVDFIAVAPAS
jgi:intracellular sulfur oxidation DsrE/DsrF family protein